VAEIEPVVEELKEGGEFEFYEGGQLDWINLEKFKADVKEATNLTRETARDLIIEIF
jgi:hypothetical protein